MSERLITQERDFEALYRSAFTAVGAGLVSSDILEKLSRHALTEGFAISILETYLLKEGHEIPHPEYGISYVDYQEITKGVAGVEKAKFMRAEYEAILRQLRDQPDQFGFDVWFE